MLKTTHAIPSDWDMNEFMKVADRMYFFDADVLIRSSNIQIRGCLSEVIIGNKFHPHVDIYPWVDNENLDFWWPKFDELTLFEKYGWYIGTID